MHTLLIKLLGQFSPPQHLRWRTYVTVVGNFYLLTDVLKNFILDVIGDLRSASAIIHIIIAISVTEPHSEAATRGVLRKKVFWEISQNPQENTCARVSFLIKL